ncbi:MAG: hypothetical protein H0X31_04940 [Nostocaceae cyanobacterium]|nr:hypothetical protein [Nostocaceae cyanobacterium]
MEQPFGYGAKIAAIAIIWAFGTGMLAICIPLVTKIENAFILPLAVIFGVSGCTVVIWRTFKPQK